MNCDASVGLSGFWYFSCATSSLRNVSLPNWSLGVGAVAAACAEAVASLIEIELSGMGLLVVH